MSGKKRDLEWALSTIPPGPTKRLSVLDEPQIRAWLMDLLERRESGEPLPNSRIAAVLTLVAKENGLKLHSDITETNLSRYLRLHRLV